MMAVALPLAGFNVDLDITGYRAAVEVKNSVFKITAALIADPPREDYMKGLTGIGYRIPYPATLPQAGNKPFCNFYFQFTTRLRVFTGQKKFNGNKRCAD
jgi:hypothetical protein